MYVLEILADYMSLILRMFAFVQQETSEMNAFM